MKQREKKIIVRNPNGVHSRVATKLAKIARKHEVKLYIIHCGQLIDCSSVLDVLGMAFVQGSSFVVRVDGEQPERALRAVEKLFARRDV